MSHLVIAKGEDKMDHDKAMEAFATADAADPPFGLTQAMERAVHAVKHGFVRDDEGMAFASWLIDTYRDETNEYVNGIPTSTLRDRFLQERS